MKKTIVLTFLLVSPMSFADTSNTEALKACTEIQSDQDRLSCFDQVMASGELGKTKVQDKYITAKIPTHETENIIVSNEKSNVPINDEANFGIEGKVILEQANLSDSIVAQVESIKESARGYKTLTLSNQQRWTQTESRTFRIKVGDNVVITRAAMDSFKMKKQGTNRTIRVSRLD